MAEAYFKGNQYPVHPTFESIFPDLFVNTPQHRTMLDWYKLRILYELALTTVWLPGDVAEAGVWKGGVTYLLASAVNGKKIVHSFDSWQGLPGLTDEDVVESTGRVKGKFKGWGATEVPREFLSKFGDNVILYEGWFTDTFPKVADKQFCLVHVDCDLYQPIKECLEFFVPRMVAGGWMVFDDYNEPDLYPGAVKAVDDYFRIYDRKYEFYTWANVIVRFLE